MKQKKYKHNKNNKKQRKTYSFLYLPTRDLQSYHEQVVNTNHLGNNKKSLLVPRIRQNTLFTRKSL